MFSLFVGVVALGAVMASDADFDESDVLVLTKDNFDAETSAAELMLVEFYAPWCGHCKHLAPEYAKAATALKSEDPPIKLAKVDATVETELASKFSVSGYPTLKVFRKGKATDFDGPREANGIVKKLRSLSGPSAPVLSSAEAFDKFISHPSEIGVVAFVKAGSHEASTFTAVADQLREDYRFALVTDAAVTKHAGASASTYVAYRPASFETRKEATAAKGSSDDVKRWVIKQSVPLAGVYDASNAKSYAALGLPRIVVWSTIDRVKAPKQIDYYVNRLRKVAKDYVGKLSFVVADKSQAEFGELNFDKAASFGLGAIGVDGSKYKAPTSDKFTVEAVAEFAKLVLDGDVEKYVKSEPEPASNDDAVKVVVGTSFDRIVRDKSKDVFIEFYAPWCGHCKQLAPKWEELAKKLAPHSDTLTIAKIDATANDIPAEFGVRGYPTIFLVKNDGSAPLKYEGGREVAEMQKWLKKNVSRKLTDKPAKDDL